MKTKNAVETPQLLWAPFLTLYRREIHRFLKVVFQTVFTPLINSTLYLLIFGISLGQNIQLASGISYLSFLIPGLVMMSVLNNAFQNSASSIVSGKFSGDLEDLKVVPISLNQILWALAIGGLTRGVIVGAITFIVGQAFHFWVLGEWMYLAHPIALIYFLAAGGLSFAMLGVAVAFWAKTFDQMSAFGAFLLMPLIYLGGVFFSIENLHPFWKTISMFNPLLYFINGVRFGVLGQSDVPVWTAAGITFLALSAFYIVAMRSLKYSPYTRW